VDCGCDGPPPGGNFWIGAEHLILWTKDGPSRTPLLTTGPPQSLGFLDRPGTQVQFGDSGFGFGTISGGQIEAGLWFNCEHTIGVEASGFVTEQAATGIGVRSNPNGNPVFTRPFTNAITGQQNGDLVAFPGAFAGSVGITATSQFWGSEINGVVNLRHSDEGSFDLLVGFRYFGLDEGLHITSESSNILPAGISGFNGNFVRAPNTIGIADAFATHNNFFGGQIGGRGTVCIGKATLALAAEFALGGTQELVNIAGSTSLTVPGRPTITVPGGLLALSSNSGHLHHDEFGFLPQVEATFTYHLCHHVDLFVGYTFLYLSDVARPGAQVNPVLNTTLIPASLNFGPLVGPLQPVREVHQSDFWAQGLHLGAALNF
jgi:hypothetical protein